MVCFSVPFKGHAVKTCTLLYSSHHAAVTCAGYSSDITRCWPVSGSFSPQQRDIYEAVLQINRPA